MRPLFLKISLVLSLSLTITGCLAFADVAEVPPPAANNNNNNNNNNNAAENNVGNNNGSNNGSNNDGSNNANNQRNNGGENNQNNNNRMPRQPDCIEVCNEIVECAGFEDEGLEAFIFGACSGGDNPICARDDQESWECLVESRMDGMCPALAECYTEENLGCLERCGQWNECWNPSPFPFLGKDADQCLWLCEITGGEEFPLHCDQEVCDENALCIVNWLCDALCLPLTLCDIEGLNEEEVCHNKCVETRKNPHLYLDEQTVPFECAFELADDLTVEEVCTDLESCVEKEVDCESACETSAALCNGGEGAGKTLCGLGCGASGWNKERQSCVQFSQTCQEVAGCLDHSAFCQCD